MDKISASLVRNGAAFVSFALGLLLGLLVWQPEGWKLPDPVLTLLGAIIGAAGAVGGAFLLWQAQERKHARSVAIRINQYLLVLFGKHTAFIEDVRSANRNGVISQRAKSFADQLAELTERILPYAKELHVLQENQAAAFIGIELALDELEMTVGKLRSASSCNFESSHKSRAEFIDTLDDLRSTLEENRKPFT